MKHISTTPFGRRPVDSGILASQHIAVAPANMSAVDKWTVFDDLKAARDSFGLKDRDLAVLNALLSFHPDRDLIDGVDPIVFPSNTSLSDRVHGMPESTLRRHLSALIKAGVIARRDSPNGKRYRRRHRSGEAVIAFGFSLRPLLVRANEIRETAESIRIEQDRLSAHRETVVMMLRDATKLLAFVGSEIPSEHRTEFDAALATIRNHLRRKTIAERLDDLHSHVLNVLTQIKSAVRMMPETPILNGNDSQNERHQQNSNPESFDSERQSHSNEISPPSDVIATCSELGTFAQIDIQSENDLTRAAERVAPMMGIDMRLWANAVQVFGRTHAAVIMAVLLRHSGRIRNISGYLHVLIQKTLMGVVTPSGLLSTLMNPNFGRSPRRFSMS